MPLCPSLVGLLKPTPDQTAEFCFEEAHVGIEAIVLKEAFLTIGRDFAFAQLEKFIDLLEGEFEAVFSGSSPFCNIGFHRWQVKGSISSHLSDDLQVQLEGLEDQGSLHVPGIHEQANGDIEPSHQQSSQHDSGIEFGAISAMWNHAHKEGKSALSVFEFADHGGADKELSPDVFWSIRPVGMVVM